MVRLANYDLSAEYERSTGWFECVLRFGYRCRIKFNLAARREIFTLRIPMGRELNFHTSITETEREIMGEKKLKNPVSPLLNEAFSFRGVNIDARFSNEAEIENIFYRLVFHLK